MPPPGLLKRLPGDCHRHPYSTGVDTAVLALTTPRREPLRFVARAASPQCVIEQRFDRLAFGRVNSAVERVASGLGRRLGRGRPRKQIRRIGFFDAAATPLRPHGILGTEQRQRSNKCSVGWRGFGTTMTAFKALALQVGNRERQKSTRLSRSGRGRSMPG